LALLIPDDPLGRNAAWRFRPVGGEAPTGPHSDAASARAA
jgi:hypothetical protein